MIEFARATFHFREVVAVQWQHKSLQTADARVHVYLRGGHKLTEWFRQDIHADRKAIERKVGLLAEIEAAQWAESRE